MVVTGANSGLGLVSARELARAGATVVMGCRHETRGEVARRDVAAVAATEPELERLDLASLESVRAFASNVAARHPKLDVLMNNAGIMAPPRSETPDGFELQFGTNHLGHFALTGLLLDPVLAADAGRVVTLSSTAHWVGRIDLDDLQSERHYWRWTAYGQSKLANLLFARELQVRAGDKLLSVAAHPGYAATRLQTSGPGAGGGPFASARKLGMRALNAVVAQSDEMGALPQLYAAVEEVPPGSFVGPSGRDQMRGHPKLVGSTKAGTDMDVASRLWEVSAELTGVGFDALRP